MQDVRVCAVDTEDNTYSISCVFLSCSEARGCVYTLVGVVDRVGDVTGTIEMGDSEEVRVELRPSSQVLAYDWERDGSFGTLPVRKIISDTCPAAAHGQWVIATDRYIVHPSLFHSTVTAGGPAIICIVMSLVTLSQFTEVV